MTERSTFTRFVLVGALTLTGLLLSAMTADAAGPGAPKRAGTAPGLALEAPAAHAAASVRVPAAVGRRAAHTFAGQGFDTCQAPDLATMTAWRAHSSYGAAGIYFGGRARACAPQTHLTPDWVRQTTSAGWSLLPIYVGSQSPCVTGSNKNPYRIDTKQPTTQGASEGRDAVKSAGALGLDPGSALYLDMEAYDIKNASCASTTLKYVQAWDKSVHAAGYVAGFYSSADSGIRHMEVARTAGSADLPDAVWYARWDVTPTLTGEPSLSPSAWTPHGRVHQYHGAVSESHGGKKLTVDRDLVDAPVAVVG
jgi:Domain of unknown function (DUF1906)